MMRSPPAVLDAALPASARRSRRRCWTRRSSPGWATSMSARRCSARGSQPAAAGAHRSGRAGGAAGAGDQGDADRGDRRRRVIVARLRAAGRGTGLFPARLEGLWARGRALRALSGPARLRWRAADRAVGPQHVLLPADPAVATSRTPPAGTSDTWPTTRTSSSRPTAGSA